MLIKPESLAVKIINLTLIPLAFLVLAAGIKYNTTIIAGRHNNEIFLNEPDIGIPSGCEYGDQIPLEDLKCQLPMPSVADENDNIFNLENEPFIGK